MRRICLILVLITASSFLFSQENMGSIYKENNNTETERPQVPSWEVISGTQYTIVMMIRIELNGTTFDSSGNNMVAVFGSNGSNDCRAIGVWQDLATTDDFWYLTTVGNNYNEELILKIYDENSNTIYSSDETFYFLEDTYGTITNPYEAAIGTISSPQNITITKNQNLVNISWDSVFGARNYIVQKSSNPHYNFQQIAVTDQTNYEESLPSSDQTFYRVIAINN